MIEPSTLKRWFGIPWLLLVLLAALHSSVMMISSNTPLPWAAAALSLWPILIFFGSFAVAGKGRSPVVMRWPLLCAIAGSALLLLDFSWLPLLYSALLGVIGILLYDHWNSVMPAVQNTSLQTDQVLPSFSVRSTTGSTVSSEMWRNQPLLLLFIRGNWCPLCVAQVKELADEYQRLAEKNVRLVIVSAQPLQETQQLAKKFSVPFEFYADPDASAARALGILHRGGTPLGLPGYEADTVIPTVVLCDDRGVIRFLDITGNYRDRPEPEQLFKTLGL